MWLPSRREVLRASCVSAIAIAGCTNQDEQSDNTAKVTEATHIGTTTQQTETQTAMTQKTTKESAECMLYSFPEEGWPLPDRDPANTNYTPLETNSTEKPSVRWRKRAEPPKSHKNMRTRFTDPVVTTDRIFVGKELLPSTHTEMPEENALHAYDRASGKLVWTYSTGNEVPRAIAVMGDTVYVATGYTLHAVRRSDGTHRWILNPKENVESMLPVNGQIYVTTNSESVITLGTDGDEKWTASVGDRIPGDLAVSDGTVFVGTDDGTVTAFRVEDGQRRWSKELAASQTNDVYSVRNLTVTECGLLGTANGNVFALDRSGSVRWRTGGKYTALSTDGRNVYAGTADGYLRAISIANGTLRWETFLGIADTQMADGILEDPVITDKTVFVSSRPENLYSLNKNTGRQQWRLMFDSLSHAGKPIVVRNDLFVSVGESLISLT